MLEENFLIILSFFVFDNSWSFISYCFLSS